MIFFLVLIVQVVDLAIANTRKELHDDVNTAGEIKEVDYVGIEYSGDGAAITVSCDGEFHLKDCVLMMCTCDGNGGGIAASDSSTVQTVVIIENTKFIGCHGGTNGGCIYSNNIKKLTVLNCTIVECNSEIFGGAIYISEVRDDVSIEETSFSRNGCKGGTCYFINCDVLLKECVFIYNIIDNGYGGCMIWNDDSDHGLTIVRIYFEGNSANRGGCIYFNESVPSELVVKESVFDKNEAEEANGGSDIYIHVEGGEKVSLSVKEIEKCRSSSSGVRVGYGGGGEVEMRGKLLPDSHEPTYVNGGGSDGMFCGSADGSAACKTVRFCSFFFFFSYFFISFSHLFTFTSIYVSFFI
jgi:hypothetical protein